MEPLLNPTEQLTASSEDEFFAAIDWTGFPEGSQNKEQPWKQMGLEPEGEWEPSVWNVPGRIYKSMQIIVSCFHSAGTATCESTSPQGYLLGSLYTKLDTRHPYHGTYLLTFTIELGLGSKLRWQVNGSHSFQGGIMGAEVFKGYIASMQIWKQCHLKSSAYKLKTWGSKTLCFFL